MVKKLFLGLLIGILCLSTLTWAAWKDSNGIWHEAEDVRPGTFGEDEVQYFNLPENLYFFKYLSVGLIYDADSTSFYLNPSGNSNLNKLNVNNELSSGSLATSSINSTSILTDSVSSNTISTNGITSSTADFDNISSTSINSDSGDFNNINAGTASFDSLTVNGGNVVHGCVKKTNANYANLKCDTNTFPKSMIFNQSGTGTWDLYCCRIN